MFFLCSLTFVRICFVAAVIAIAVVVVVVVVLVIVLNVVIAYGDDHDAVVLSKYVANDFLSFYLLSMHCTIWALGC